MCESANCLEKACQIFPTVLTFFPLLSLIPEAKDVRWLTNSLGLHHWLPKEFITFQAGDLEGLLN